MRQHPYRVLSRMVDLKVGRNHQELDMIESWKF